MPLPLLVIITGPPGAGKTTLGRRLAHDLNLPFFHKDAIKERLHDRLGTADREASRQLGLASYDILYYSVETLLAARLYGIVESNFASELASPIFSAMRERYPFRPVQIVCRANAEQLYARRITRAATGERHPAHWDHRTPVAWTPEMLAASEAPLAIGGEVIVWDTTDDNQLDYDGLLARLRTLRDADERD